MWETIDSDFVLLLEQQKGLVEKKLERMGAIIYSYGPKRVGVKGRSQREQKGPLIQSKSRRQQEIDRLVKERRQLRKQWRKITETERVGLDELQAEIKRRAVEQSTSDGNARGKDGQGPTSTANLTALSKAFLTMRRVGALKCL